MTSILYRNPRVYALAMQILYRGALDERNRAVAERIETGAQIGRAHV